VPGGKTGLGPAFLDWLVKRLGARDSVPFPIVSELHWRIIFVEDGREPSPQAAMPARRTELPFPSGPHATANWEQNSNRFVASKKNPCSVPFNTPHGFVFLIVAAVPSGMKRE